MTDKMIETRKPGHIALISYIDVVPDTLLTAESNDSPDMGGHRGPKHSRKLWTGVKTGPTGKYIEIDNTGKVLIVRPPANFS